MSTGQLFTASYTLCLYLTFHFSCFHPLLPVHVYVYTYMYRHNMYTHIYTHIHVIYHLRLFWINIFKVFFFFWSIPIVFVFFLHFYIYWKQQTYNMYFSTSQCLCLFLRFSIIVLTFGSKLQGRNHTFSLTVRTNEKWHFPRGPRLY